MRKHLYKAKTRGENGIWVQGSLIVGEFNKYLGYAPHYIVKPKAGILDIINDYFEVDRDTVCQYVGIYDIDNQPIFEGDNIEIKGCGIHAVEFINDDDFLGFNFASYEAPSLNKYNVLEYDMKIVGNIHDPKLKKKTTRRKK